MNRFKICTTLSFAIAVVLSVMSATAASADEKKERFFEMRTYTTHEGKLDDLHARFRDHTNRLFKKHGMQLVGYWTPADGDGGKNTLVYMLAYESRDARDKAWKGFINDPVWKKAFKASREDGPIVMKVKSEFLTPTDYSPIK